MSVLNNIAMDSALHASNALASAGRISREMGSGPHGEDDLGTLERTFVPCCHRGEIVMFGTWPREADGKPEPIQWRVVGESAQGTKLLVATEIIERRSAHDFKGDVNWQQSSLRYWLHKVFMSHAFTPQDRLHIPTVQLVTFDNDEFDTIGCFGTEDRVFCLSREEALRFFPTDAARSVRRSGYTERLPSLPCWWLRSPGGHQFAFQTAGEDGALDANGFHATLDCVGVRPALLMNPTVTPENMPRHLSPDKHKAANVRNGASGVPTQARRSGTSTAPVTGSNATTDDPFGPDDRAFCGRRETTGPGYALAYADEQLARRALARASLIKAQPDLAIAGGYPSVLLINRLIGDGTLDTKNQFQLCQSAIRAHEATLVKRMVSSRAFGEYRLGQLLNTCISAGLLELALFLVRSGAPSDGYAKAFLPSASQEAVAACAAAVDPAGALDQWEYVRRWPSAVRQLVSAARTDAQRGTGVRTAGQNAEKLFSLPGILPICAENGFYEETRYLVEESGRHPDASQFAEAIQAAKRHGHAEMCAYLIDRQATYCGTAETRAPAPSAAWAADGHSNQSAAQTSGGRADQNGTRKAGGRLNRSAAGEADGHADRDAAQAAGDGGTAPAAPPARSSRPALEL